MAFKSPAAEEPKIHPFFIQVVDDQTNRGVPLIELRTTSSVRYYDSAGIAAFDDATPARQTVFFYVSRRNRRGRE